MSDKLEQVHASITAVYDYVHALVDGAIEYDEEKFDALMDATFKDTYTAGVDSGIDCAFRVSEAAAKQVAT